MNEPKWMKRPDQPGMWVCIGKDKMRGQDVVLRITDVDIANGAPFYTEAVYGPIPLRPDVLLEDER